MNNPATDYLQNFIQHERLNDDYLASVQQWFQPLAQRLVEQRRRQQQPLLVGINGCQGSGKSTLARLLVEILKHEHGYKSVALSLDDFYLSQAERQLLDRDVHPLLASRGLPGTHNIPLAQKTLQCLLQGESQIAIPRFNKAADEPAPQDEWPVTCAPVDLIILEGWCLGVGAQNFLELIDPVNKLERQEDKDGIWRHFVNTQLQQHYQPLFKLIDTMIMLKAPSFDCVYRWRLEQEDKLRDSIAPGDSRDGLMSSEQISRFIQYFQRLTEHCLEVLPDTVDHLFTMDEQRNISDYSAR